MRTMAIEQALRWAYRDELPKAQALGDRLSPAEWPRGWQQVERFGDYLAVLDEPVPLNRFGLVADDTADAAPHPDAVQIHEAVAALDACPFFVPADWYPLSDMGDLGDLGREAVARALDRVAPLGRGGERWMRSKLAALVQKHAILGGEPDWEGDLVEVRIVSERGKPRWFRRERVQIAAGDEHLGICAEFITVEVDGFNQARQRPWPDAYRKVELFPDPLYLIIQRAEYLVWRMALDTIADAVNGQMASIHVTASTRPMTPWESAHRGVVSDDENENREYA